MKVGIATNKDNYQYYVFRRAIHICWVVLAVCLIIKLFGGNYFGIICDNARVVAFATWIDNHFIGKFALGIVSSGISYTFYYLAIMKMRFFTVSQAVFVYASVVLFVALRLVFQTVPIVCVSFDVAQFFAIPILLCRKEFKRCVIPRIVVGILLMILFQVVSMLVKNVSLNKYISNNTLTGTIFMIDVFIMLCLYYLYSNNLDKRGKTGKMGMWLNWLFGKSITQLERMKQKRKKKIAKLRVEISEIDKAIAIEKAESENETDAK